MSYFAPTRMVLMCIVMVISSDLHAVDGVILTLKQRALAGNSLALQKPSFLAHRDYLVGNNPQTITKADLNGDGITDLILPNFDTGVARVSVLFGKGDGSFRAPFFVNTGGISSFQSVVGDFNGDGHLDLAVTTLQGLSIVLGDGQGNFGAPQLFSVGNFLEGIVAADFDGDHKLDLAVTANDTNQVLVMHGAGDGTFSLSAALPVGMSPCEIVAGDFNHDGRIDLAVANSGISDGHNQGPHGNTVAVLLGQHNGQFQPAHFIPVARGPLGIAAGDFNHDSEQDLVVANSRTDQLTVLLGHGDGSFSAPKAFTVTRKDHSPRQTYLPSGVALDDFNGDGNLDLAAENVGTSTVAVLFGDGKGNFSKPLNLPVGRAEGLGMGIATGDFNHDGKVDLISGNGGADSLSVVLGKGNGRFVREKDFPTGEAPTGEAGEQMVLADFNHDGIPDVATADSGNGTGRTVSVLLGKKGGGFQAPKVTAVGHNVFALASADFNRDGKTDLVVVHSALNKVSILLGRGDGTFSSPLQFPVGNVPDSVAVGDFNGDGNADIAVSNFHGPISILLGEGNGRFHKGEDVAIPGALFLDEVTVADFDRDGKLDLAILTERKSDGEQMIKVALGNGDGTFQHNADVTSSFFIFCYAIGDFNGDGIPDFAAEEGGEIEMLLGDGHGRFHSVGKFREGEGSGFSVVLALAVGDFNGDGFLDLAAPDGFSDNLMIFVGRGDGTLQLVPKLFGAEGGAGSVVVADFNGDHRADIALASTDTQNLKGNVVLLLNNSPSRRSSKP
jgi:hypothetical protein